MLSAFVGLPQLVRHRLLLQGHYKRPARLSASSGSPAVRGRSWLVKVSPPGRPITSARAFLRASTVSVACNSCLFQCSALGPVLGFCSSHASRKPSGLPAIMPWPRTLRLLAVRVTETVLGGVEGDFAHSGKQKYCLRRQTWNHRHRLGCCPLWPRLLWCCYFASGTVSYSVGGQDLPSRSPLVTFQSVTSLDAKHCWHPVPRH